VREASACGAGAGALDYSFGLRLLLIAQTQRAVAAAASRLAGSCVSSPSASRLRAVSSILSPGCVRWGLTQVRTATVVTDVC
jgi:hypothetical protein